MTNPWKASDLHTVFMYEYVLTLLCTLSFFLSRDKSMRPGRPLPPACRSHLHKDGHLMTIPLKPNYL